MPAAAHPPTLASLFPASLTLGEPDVSGPLAVFPLFGGEPRLEYLSYAEAASRGLEVTELPEGASVNDLLVVNPLALPVLLYEGEELIGAQQNRTVDAAVLVGAGVKTSVPVSCVEHGRWDGRRHDEAFAPSAQAAYPELRRQKSRRIREGMAAGLEARADQGEVWQAVAAKAERLQAASPTDAMSDIYGQRRDSLDQLVEGVRRRDHQLGSLVAIDGRFSVLDCVSRPDVYAALHGPLVQGYALDALEHEPGAPPSRSDAAVFLAGVVGSPVTRAPSAGLGDALHFTGGHSAGTGLVHDGEVLQLCAFAADASASSARIRRPSQRR